MWWWQRLRRLDERLYAAESALRDAHDWIRRHENLIAEASRARQADRKKTNQRLDTLEFQAAEGAFETTMSANAAKLTQAKRNRKAKRAVS